MLLYGFTSLQEALDSTNFWSQGIDISQLQVLVADKYDQIDYSFGSASFICFDGVNQYSLILRYPDDFSYQTSVRDFYQQSPKESFIQFLTENQFYFPNFTLQEVIDVLPDSTAFRK